MRSQPRKQKIETKRLKRAKAGFSLKISKTNKTLHEPENRQVLDKFRNTDAERKMK